MNFLKIAWEDISAIFKNRFIRVSVVAIIIVPLLYSLLYLYAFWNPYDKLSDMPVAVVNMDKGGSKDGKDVNYGKDVVKKLKENNKIGWRFVDYNEAKSGVEGKKYYGMFVIPENFTSDALTVQQKELIQAKIDFISNDKKNFLAAQINGKVVVELEAEITASMHKAIYATLFENLNEIKDKMQLAADGSKQISDGNSELAGKIPEMKDGVGKLYDGSSKVTNGLAALNGSVPELKDGVVQLYDGSTQLKDGLAQLNGKIPEMKDGVGQLYDGSTRLKSGLLSAKGGALQIYDAVSQISGGLGQLNSKVPELSKGVNDLCTGSGTLSVGLDTAYNGSKTLKDGYQMFIDQAITPLSSGVQGISSGLTTRILPNLGQLKDGSSKLATGLGLANGGATQLDAGAKDLSTGSAGLKTGADKLNSGIQLFTPGITKISNGAKSVADGVDTLISKTTTSQTALQNAVNTQLNAYLAAHPEALNDANMKSFINTLTALGSAANDPNNTTQIQALQKGAHDVADGAALLGTSSQDLATGLQGFATGANDYATGASKFAVGASQLSAGLNDAIVGSKTISDGLSQLYTGMNTDFKAGIDKMNSSMPVIMSNANKLNDGVIGLNDGLYKLNTGATTLNGGLTQLNGKIPELAGGVNKLYEGSLQLMKGLGKPEQPKKNALSKESEDNTLLGGLNQLVVGSTQLNDGLGKLNTNVPALADGANQLYNGSVKLNDGLGKLNTNVPALADGASKLYDGSSQVTDGLGTLNGKMPELQDGTTKLKDGSKELSDKLADGSKELNGKILNDSDTMSQFLSKPVEINEKAINAVKTYGAGFAPYFISLSLWVGGMLMFFVIPVDIDDKIKARSSSIVLGKFISYGIIGVIQAVLASGIVLTLGLQPTNMLLYFGFNVLMSFVFIAIMQCLVFLAGDAGRLLSIVLLILQLTACAGTFPLEVVPTFFKVLNPFMPFTYTVEALREIISGVNYSIVYKDAGILVAVMAVAIITSVLLKGHADKVQEAIKARKEAVA